MEIRKYATNKVYARAKKKEIKRSIKKALGKLAEKILVYHSKGVEFEQIFDDDSIKYDKHGNCYTFKSHDKDNTQLRILYACIIDKKNEQMNIAIIDYHIKRRNTKEYISTFDWANNLTYEQIFKKNDLIEL